MKRFLLVCLGGAAGTGARYLVGGWAASAFGPAFPYGTLGINALGSFLISAVMHLGLVAAVVPPDLRVVLAVGVLGGFTTYSSFNYETLAYFQRGAWAFGLLYAAAMLFGCALAGVMGLAAARLLAGT
jgi:CrcB protein